MRKSAGILLFRMRDDEPQVFLVHPGGPTWKKRDLGAWSIPKGEFTDDEDPLDAAKREFKEETGKGLHGEFIPLEPIRQKGGKQVHAWAVQGDIDAERIVSNTFEQEWPYKSGKMQTFPEVDKGAWFSMDEAAMKINEAQATFLNQLLALLNKTD